MVVFMSQMYNNKFVFNNIGRVSNCHRLLHFFTGILVGRYPSLKY